MCSYNGNVYTHGSVAGISLSDLKTRVRTNIFLSSGVNLLCVAIPAILFKSAKVNETKLVYCIVATVQLI